MKASAYRSIKTGIDLDYGEVVTSENWLVTTEHAASSYGVPVAIRIRDGAVFGPEEMKGTELLIAGSIDMEDRRSRTAIAAELREHGYNAS